MLEKKHLILKLAVNGNQSDINEIRTIIDHSDLDIQILPTAPLHMGSEVITLVLTVIGTVTSVTAFFSALWERKEKFEIQVKTKDNEIISLGKKTPWTLGDIRKFLKLEED